MFSTLTIAMRYEPANAKFFAIEVSLLFNAQDIYSCYSEASTSEQQRNEIFVTIL